MIDTNEMRKLANSASFDPSKVALMNKMSTMLHEAAREIDILRSKPVCPNWDATEGECAD